MPATHYANALEQLRVAVIRYKPGGKNEGENRAGREEAFAKYQPIFSVEHLPSLTKEEFIPFLYLENNKHWNGLYRKGLKTAEKIADLRAALRILLDETVPIRQRFLTAIDRVVGMGKALASAILTVAYPEKYGVWNNTSESALRKLQIWPTFEHGEGIGGQYEKVNQLLIRLKSDLGIDLWTLDKLWWDILNEDAPSLISEDSSVIEAVGAGSAFALEKQLEEFLLENWEKTPLAQDWNIYSEPGESEAGNQFPTDVGPIDILAVHKKGGRYLVIELKRNQSSDQTVAQILRYIGWIKIHKAKQGEDVEGLIIAHEPDSKVAYALVTQPKIKMMTYEVEFRLKHTAVAAKA